MRKLFKMLVVTIMMCGLVGCSNSDAKIQELEEKIAILESQVKTQYTKEELMENWGDELRAVGIDFADTNNNIEYELVGNYIVSKKKSNYGWHAAIEYEVIGDQLFLGNDVVAIDKIAE